MMKNSKLKFSEHIQNISRSKSFGKFVLRVKQNPKHLRYQKLINVVLLLCIDYSFTKHFISPNSSELAKAQNNTLEANYHISVNSFHP